jgi:hypothetical protein
VSLQKDYNAVTLNQYVEASATVDAQSLQCAGGKSNVAKWSVGTKVAKRFVPKNASKSSDGEDSGDDEDSGEDEDNGDDENEEDDGVDKKWFTGRIEEHFDIDDDGYEYMVLYCDSDQEDASADDMMRLVNDFSKHKEAIKADARSLGHPDVDYDSDEATPASQGNGECTTAVTVGSSGSKKQQHQQCVEPPLQQQQFIVQQQQSQTQLIQQ